MTRLISNGTQHQRFKTAAGGIKWGTLGMQQFASTQAALDYAAGLRIGMFEITWANYQPTSQAAQDNSYVASILTALGQVQSAGFNDLTLSTGSHYQASWITGGANSTKFLAEDGTTYSSGIDTVWAASGRLIWQQYIDRVANDIGLNNFTVIRINSISDGEFLYESSPARHFFAYGAAPQLGTGLATGQAITPFPGWITGSANNGVTTAAQVQTWLTWYLQSLVNSAAWQMAYFRSKGFTGKFEVLCSGTGSFPNNTTTQVNGFLPNPSNIVAVGAVWDQLIPLLAALTEAPNIVIELSAMGDGSGQPVDNVAGSTDQAVTVSGTNVNNWSATRWVAYNATKAGFALAGENTGFSTGNAVRYADPSNQGVMALAVQQAKAAGLSRYYWAHDNKLQDGTVTLANYAANIAD